jgi:hypothetical protein
VQIEEAAATCAGRQSPGSKTRLVLGLLLLLACESRQAQPGAAASPAQTPAASPGTPAAAGPAVSQPLRAATQEAKPVKVAADYSNFASFWGEFRAALLASDWAALERMSKFPVEVNGELDDEPVRKVERAQLPKLLQKLLAQKSQKDETRTVRQDLEQKPTPQAPAPDKNQVRVNEFHFERSAGQWRFVATYLDSSVQL